MNVKTSSPDRRVDGGATVLAPIAWGTTYVTVTELLPPVARCSSPRCGSCPPGSSLLVAGAVASRWRPRGAEWGRTGAARAVQLRLVLPAARRRRLPAARRRGRRRRRPAAAARRRACRGCSPGAGRGALELAVGVVAALGVGLVVVRPGADLDAVGVLAAVGANVSFAVGVVLTKRFPAPPNRLAATGWQLLLGGVVLVPLTAVVEGAPPALTGAQPRRVRLPQPGRAPALAFVLWFNGIRRLPTAAPPLLGLAAPVTGALLGWVVLGQSLSPVQLAGFAVTLGAIAYGASLGASAPAAAPVSARLVRMSRPARITDCGDGLRTKAALTP